MSLLFACTQSLALSRSSEKLVEALVVVARKNLTPE